MSIVFLNGEYVPVEAAKVSVLDRAYTFGDAVYEVIPVYGDHIFRLQEHLHRLNNSLQAINVDNPCSNEHWQEIISGVLRRNGKHTERSIYLQVSRGVSDREHLSDEVLTPGVFVMCRPVKEPGYSAGVSVVTHEDIRWKYCHIKATTLLANVLLKQYAKDTDGSVECILVKDGYITEGASSNVFVVNDGVLSTPEKDGSVLPGVTRDLVIELLKLEGLGCMERTVTLAMLQSAGEVWLTSSGMGIVPVIQIDGRQLADGAPGRLWHRANHLFQEFKTNQDILGDS